MQSLWNHGGRWAAFTWWSTRSGNPQYSTTKKSGASAIKSGRANQSAGRALPPESRTFKAPSDATVR
nr:hypothetical protein CFP56_19345 [Quercus suber]